MTVGELIRQLQEFPADMQVMRLKDEGYGRGYHWETMDGHWWQTPSVKRSSEGYYLKATSRDDDDPEVEVLEILEI